MATFKNVKSRFKSKSIIKDGIHLGTLITKSDGGTLDIIETKHLNSLSKMFRDEVPLDGLENKEYFELNAINMKWEYIIKFNNSAIVFSEYDRMLDVYGYKDFENDIKPILRTNIHLESSIKSQNNFLRFLQCIDAFRKKTK